jgi:hypothetical protein
MLAQCIQNKLIVRRTLYLLRPGYVFFYWFILCNCYLNNTHFSFSSLFHLAIILHLIRRFNKGLFFFFILMNLIRTLAFNFFCYSVFLFFLFQFKQSQCFCWTFRLFLFNFYLNILGLWVLLFRFRNKTISHSLGDCKFYKY